MTDLHMRLTSYHNHLSYCDGSGTAVDYAEVALAAGLESLGISCHAPVPFASDWNMTLASLPAYCAEVRAAQEAYRGRLPIYLGVELDYVAPNVAPHGIAFHQEKIFPHRFDYVVASVHYVGHDPDGAPWTIDYTAESFERQLAEVYRGDVRRLIEDYYGHVIAMAGVAPSWQVPVIVGHVDKVKMWNVADRYFAEDESWYLAAVDEALQAIRAAQLVVEVNTAGLRRAHGEPYPGPRVLRRCRELGIPVTISSDAHQPADLAARFNDAATILREVGFTEVVALVDGRWIARPHQRGTT